MSAVAQCIFAATVVAFNQKFIDKEIDIKNVGANIDICARTLPVLIQSAFS